MKTDGLVLFTSLTRLHCRLSQLLVHDGESHVLSVDRKHLALLFGLLVSGSAVLIGYLYAGDFSLPILIMGFLVMVASAIHGAKYDLRHPWVWFGGGLALYSVGAPVLYLMDLFDVYQSYNHVIILEYVALLSFLLGAFCERQDYSAISYKGLADIRAGAVPIMILSFAISILYLASYLRLGEVMKTEKHFAGNVYLKLDIAYSVLIVAFVVIAVARVREGAHPPYLLLFLMTIYFVLSFLIGGERGIVVRLVLSYVLIHITFYPHVKRAYLFCGILVLIMLSTAMGMYKNYLLTGEQTGVAGRVAGEMGFSMDTVALLLLGSEFQTPSANLALLSREIPERISFWWGRSTLTEIVAVFYVGFLSDRDVLPSTASWFTREFFPDFYEAGGGQGFTLVGQGYLDFGVVGVIVLFWVIGMVVRKVYSWSAKSAVGLVVSLGMIPNCLYSIRQTIAPAMSQTLKHVIVPLLVMYVIGKAVRGCSQSRVLEPPVKDSIGNRLAAR